MYCSRENVTAEESISKNAESDTNGFRTEEGCLSFANIVDMLKQGQIPPAPKLANAKPSGFSGFANHSCVASVSGAYQVSLLERMCTIATKSNDELVRREALSVMNLILMRHNAYLERDK